MSDQNKKVLLGVVVLAIAGYGAYTFLLSGGDEPEAAPVVQSTPAAAPKEPEAAPAPREKVKRPEPEAVADPTPERPKREATPIEEEAPAKQRDKIAPKKKSVKQTKPAA